MRRSSDTFDNLTYDQKSDFLNAEDANPAKWRGIVHANKDDAGLAQYTAARVVPTSTSYDQFNDLESELLGLITDLGRIEGD